MVCVRVHMPVCVPLFLIISLPFFLTFSSSSVTTLPLNRVKSPCTMEWSGEIGGEEEGEEEER